MPAAVYWCDCRWDFEGHAPPFCRTHGDGMRYVEGTPGDPAYVKPKKKEVKPKAKATKKK